MIFEQFYLACLSHASYLIGSEGEAAVVDPQRDIDIYVEFARSHNLRIRHVIETHVHADFVSGHRELAERFGAKIYMGAGSGATFPHVAAGDGDEIRFGRCVLRFLSTPGHTIESICVTVTDLDRSPQPFAVLTGDTLFIGDVGRPDLSPNHTPQQLAAMLYDSLHTKVLQLPGETEVYPAHGAGSLCGRQMSTERKSTIAMQKAGNYALQASSREEFVRLLTADLPERPEYFLKDVELNRGGVQPLEVLPPLRRFTPQEVEDLKSEGAVILDVRAAQEFCAAHVPGSVNIGLNGQFAPWAATVLPFHGRIVIVAEDDTTAEQARMRLARVGIEGVAGALDKGFPGWTMVGLPSSSIPSLQVDDIATYLETGQVDYLIDVRRPNEFNAGAIPGAVLKPLDRLSREMADYDRNAIIAVYCKGGYRSVIGASLLEAGGFTRVMNVVGGFDAWQTRGFPVRVPLPTV